MVEVLGDPTFHQTLLLPDLSTPEVLEHDRGPDGSASVLLRYEYTGRLDPIARRLLGGDRPTWTQELRIDGTGHGTLGFRAEANPGLLHGDATFTLLPDGAATLRRLGGEVVVALPGFGAMAERRIVPGVLARLDIEADAVNRRLAPG